MIQRNKRLFRTGTKETTSHTRRTMKSICPPHRIEASSPPRSIREQRKDDRITDSEGDQPINPKEVESEHAQFPFLHETEAEPHERGEKIEEVRYGNKGRNP